MTKKYVHTGTGAPKMIKTRSFGDMSHAERWATSRLPTGNTNADLAILVIATAVDKGKSCVLEKSQVKDIMSGLSHLEDMGLAVVREQDGKVGITLAITRELYKQGGGFYED